VIGARVGSSFFSTFGGVGGRAGVDFGVVFVGGGG
jgi:hypothetical protein